MRLRRSLAVSTTLLVLAATGCSGDDSSDDDSPQATNPRASAAAQPAPEPAEGGGPTQFRPILAAGDEQPAEGIAVDAALLEEFASFECVKDVTQPKPADATIACDAQGTTYLLGPAVRGGAVARAFPYEYADVLSVGLILSEPTGRQVAKAARKVDASAVALELGGVVLAAAPVATVADRGRVEITGEFTQESAQALAERITAGQ